MTFLNVLQLYLMHPLLHWWAPKLLLAPAAIRIETPLDTYILLEIGKNILNFGLKTESRCQVIDIRGSVGLSSLEISRTGISIAELYLTSSLILPQHRENDQLLFQHVSILIFHYILIYISSKGNFDPTGTCHLVLMTHYSPPAFSLWSSLSVGFSLPSLFL